MLASCRNHVNHKIYVLIGKNVRYSIKKDRVVTMYRKIIAMCLILFMTVTALNTYASAATSSEIMEGAWLGEWPNQSKYNIEAFNNLTNTQSKIIHTFVNTNQNFSVISNLMNYVHNQRRKYDYDRGES